MLYFLHFPFTLSISIFILYLTQFLYFQLQFFLIPSWIDDLLHSNLMKMTVSCQFTPQSKVSLSRIAASFNRHGEGTYAMSAWLAHQLWKITQRQMHVALAISGALWWTLVLIPNFSHCLDMQMHRYVCVYIYI